MGGKTLSAAPSPFRDRRHRGLTLLEVLIALGLSAILFGAALQLLLGVVQVWERARVGDLRADGEFRRLHFLRYHLEKAGVGAIEVGEVPRPGEEEALVFPVRESLLAGRLRHRYRTETVGLVGDRDGLRLLPVVGEEGERFREEDALRLVNEPVELVYWSREGSRWEEETDLGAFANGGDDLPVLLGVRWTDREEERWLFLSRSHATDEVLW